MSRIEKALEVAARSHNGARDSRDHQGCVGPAMKFDGLLDVDPIEFDNPRLVAPGAANIAVVEEFNKLRSAIIALARKETFRNTLMVTSSVSGEGKTLTALNLAISLAREYNHTVLLVDTDLRRPSVHKFLDLTPEVGLVQCLREGFPVERALIKTGIGKLVVLPAGGTVVDPVELLSSDQMKIIVRELKNRYSERFVVFDSPPALNFADARVLSDIVDGTIFVVREGRVTGAQLEKSISCFRDKNLLGVVCNDVKSTSPENYYY